MLGLGGSVVEKVDRRLNKGEVEVESYKLGRWILWLKYDRSGSFQGRPCFLPEVPVRREPSFTVPVYL